MKRSSWLGWTICAATGAAAVAAQSRPGLPIPQGIYVEDAMACAAATRVRVYDGNRFGDVYFYGPGQTMGPADEREVLTHVGQGEDGYTMVNDGPLEVKALGGGRVSMRAFSPSQGEAWRETARLCQPDSLPARMRAALAR
jgi:hypothetical protein